MPRPRTNSLTICISGAHNWRAPRPPTPRRQTFPGAKMPSSANTINIDVPPVPALSYFEPDTPIEVITLPVTLSPISVGFWPASPRDTFFPGFSPASPSVYSPISHNMFSHAYRYPGSLPSQYEHHYIPPGSSLSPVRLFSCIPSCEPSPMSPRFLFPRTPPLPPRPVFQSRLRSQRLIQHDDHMSPTNYCFGLGMGERRHSNPYPSSSPLVLCGKPPVPANPNVLKTVLEKKSVSQKSGWYSAGVESPVGSYFKKKEGDRERKKAIRQRRFSAIRGSEGIVIVVGVT